MFFLQATTSLKEALKETCELSPQEQGLEGRVRYYLGLAYLHHGETESAQTTLLTARPLIDGLVNDSYLTPVRLVELLHMLENLHLGMELSLVSLDRPLDALVAAECRKNTRFLKYMIYRYNMNPEVLKDAGFFLHSAATRASNGLSRETRDSSIPKCKFSSMCKSSTKRTGVR